LDGKAAATGPALKSKTARLRRRNSGDMMELMVFTKGREKNRKGKM
jgi:hypothetical protein